MADKSKKRSIKRDLSLVFRGYKLLFKMSKANMILRAVNAIWPQVSPYIGLYMSARIIDGIVAGESFDSLFTLALITVLSVLAVNVVGRWIDHFAWLYEHVMYDNMVLYINNVQNSMKYQNLENPKVLKLKQSIDHEMNYGNGGLMSLYWHWYFLFNTLFRIAASITLTVSMFGMTAANPQGWFLEFANSPLSAIIIAALIIGNVVFQTVNSNKDSRTQRRIWNDISLEYERQSLFMWRPIRPHDEISKSYKWYMRRARGFFLSRGSNNYYDKQCSVSFSNGTLRTVSTALMNIFTYLYIGAKAFSGAFGVGSFVLYRGTVEKFIDAVGTLSTRMGMIRAKSKYLEELYEYLDLPDEMYQGTLSTEKRDDNEYEIEFRNVSFKYPGSENFALKNVNFKFNIGERLAFVGMNGSGKTTFVKLLCRLYDPTEGQILLNGIDITRYDYEQYMALFSVVFQDYAVFAFDIAGNVSASSEPDRDRVLDCLVRAGLGERISELENGIDTFITKNYDATGVDFSGGEKQKIAIARALYKDAPFIILDEPTASLDPLAEADIYARFNEIVTDKTAVYISHRLSSCRFCDKIVVFDNGEIIQQGNHDTLVADENGKYFELWHAQAQHYV